MTSDILFILFHFLACFAFFALVQRPLFIWYNRTLNTERLTMADVLQIYRHGYKTDLKVASYMTLFQVLVMIAHALIPPLQPQGVLMAIVVVLSFAIGLGSVADTALYKFWQFKLDKSVFAYLRSLKGAFASVSKTYILLALMAVLAVCCVLFAVLRCAFFAYTLGAPLQTDNWLIRIAAAFAFLLIGGALYLVIRGLKRRPENTSIAYYSQNQFYNHCALNPIFNLIYSLSVKEDFAKQFQTFDKEWCREQFAPLFPTSGTPQTSILNTTRPNILIVIWEGLCSQFIGSLGGRDNVCVNIDRLSKEGVWFTNCYAGSFRTDRGIVCVLSGYLGQPTTTVIRYVKKLPNLPALPRTLRDQLGYDTTVFHGGDLTIFHKADYYLAAGHSTLVYQKDFPASAPSCPWGIHDGYMFDRVLEDIQRKTEKGTPWFSTLQTLSSHEPFEVPYDRLKDDKFANSFAYVDDCFGRFIDQLKQSPAWDNTLVVVTGDHGVNLDNLFTHAEKTHLPLLMLGGAVKKPMVFDQIVSQTDIAATLLGQMQLPHDDFTFSRDVLADTYAYPFAFHSYNNGFIFRDATGYTDYDNVSQKALENPDPKREEKGKIILQTLYNDLSKR